MAENIDNQGSERAFGEVAEREEVADVDAGGAPQETQSQEESTEDAGTEETQDTGTEGEESTEGETTEEGEQPELTEKGTKLDPKPESALHQQLANESKTRKQYEQVLGSPELLAKYMEQQFGIKIPAKQESTATVTAQPDAAKTYKAEDFENLEDVASVVNGLQGNFENKLKAYEAKISELEKSVGTLNNRNTYQEVANTMASDIDNLRSSAELNPKSPDFIEGLEQEIADTYHALDFDQETQSYKGKHSIKEIGDRMISVARKARKQGSIKAQTIVKDRSQGKVTTSTKVRSETDSSKLSPGNSIAQGVARMFNN